MTMLSTVAERVYWSARYLERVESTARMVSIYDNLLFDLPKTLNLSWYNLITINSMEKDFGERFSVQDERNVVKFLVGDKSNGSSIMSSLTAVRENVRTTRDVVPQASWELINELTLFVQDNLQQGVNRSKRHEFLDHIIKSCQQILGLFYGNMPHDESWEFMRLGRDLERADMTTRILDAGAATILELEDDENAVNSRQIIWGHVLRCLHADQYYRRTMRASVAPEAVVRYLLEDAEFPRAIHYCLEALIEASAKLPRSKPVTDAFRQMEKKALSKIPYNDLGMPLRDYLNQLQIQLGQAHGTIAQRWFPVV